MMMQPGYVLFLTLTASSLVADLVVEFDLSRMFKFHNEPMYCYRTGRLESV